MTEYIEEEIYLELYGASPKVVVFIMGIITWIFPFGAYHIVLNPEAPQNGLAGVIGFLFSMNLYDWRPFLTFSNPAISLVALGLGSLNILYVQRMYKYYNGKTSRTNAIVVGGLSLAIPLIIALGFPAHTIGYYVGPIPIQFLCGLIIMYKVPGPELRSPWAGQFMDYSWYHWRSHHKSLPEKYRGSQEDVFDSEGQTESKK